MKRRYRLFGMAFESDLELPELDSTAAPVSFRVVAERLPHAGDDWVDPWQRDPGGPRIRIQSGDGYRIRYEDQVDFHLSVDRRTLSVDVHDCPPATVRHFLLDQVLPLTLAIDHPVLHASAVVIEDRHVAFTGACGAGKSTLAALLARAGFAIAADDALVLNEAATGLHGAPAYPGLRLWPGMLAGLAGAAETLPVSERSSKRRVRANLAYDGRSLPMGAIYLLAGASDSVEIEPLSSRATAMLLIEHGFRLEQRDPRTIAREMDRACDAAKRLRAWSLRYPRRLDAADRVAAAIAAHARQQVEAACCS